MKKLSIKLFAFLLLALPLFVKAGSVGMNGTKTISPGESSTFSVTVSSSNKIKGVQMFATIDSSDFEIVSVKKASDSYTLQTSKGKINDFMVYYMDGYIPNKGTVAKITVKAKSTATPGSTATFTLKNVTLTTLQNGVEDDESASNYTTTLTVGKIKSTNNYLSTLEISNYNISFDKTKTSYTLNSTEVGTALTVKATSEDTTATVKVNSPKLVEGENRITVVVTAESGAQRTYTITVTVPKKEVPKSTDTNLKSLTVKGYDIKFNPDKTEYLLNVENEVKKVEITATLENSESTKTMDGPSELVVGENVYTITVTDKAGNTKTYNITINRKEAKTECEECKVCEECEEPDNVWKYLAIALVIVTLAETVFMITMRDKKEI